MVAADGYVEVLRYLLRIRAVRATSSIDAQNRFLAAYRGYVKGVKLLVEAGANPMIASIDGTIPMDVALQQGHQPCNELLRVSGMYSRWASSTGW